MSPYLFLVEGTVSNAIRLFVGREDVESSHNIAGHLSLSLLPLSILGRKKGNAAFRRRGRDPAPCRRFAAGGCARFTPAAECESERASSSSSTRGAAIFPRLLTNSMFRREPRFRRPFIPSSALGPTAFSGLFLSSRGHP